MMKYLALPIIFILFTTTAFAQGNKLKKANESFAAAEWLKAIEQYRDAYEVVDDKNKKTEIIFQIAECFRHMCDPQHAEMWYKKTIDREFQNPVIYLYYANALRTQGKLKEAEPMYRKYKELVPDDIRGENGIQSCRTAQQWIDFPNGYLVENFKPANSRACDNSPAFGRDDYKVIFFASTNESAKGQVREGIGEKAFDIFYTKLDKKDKWSAPVSVGDEINTEFEEGSPSINKSFTKMYFSSCKPVKGKKASAHIMVSTLSGETFGTPEMLDFAGDTVDIIHPAISNDEKTLYFVSDMPGGIGGYDIWKVTSNDEGKWGTIENMGPEINTPGNELYPYSHADGTLYFSSDGHLGLGGLDIFKAKNENGKWVVENMRSPINSYADDYGIIFQPNEERGFFSSGRDKKDIDLYSFVLPPIRFNIAGKIIDDRSEKPLAEAVIKCISSDGITTDTKSGPDGTFKFALKPNTDYVFIAFREGFLNNKARQSTKGEVKSKDFAAQINLTPIDKPIEVSDITYDFARAELRPESKTALDKLVETLNDNPNVTIEMMANTDYIGNDKANTELSQRRAQSVVDYLISKGIAIDRLSAKGNGETVPKVVDEKLSKQFSFLPAGTVLNETFIKTLTPDNQEFANQVNRRTEFKVLRTDYVPKQ